MLTDMINVFRKHSIPYHIVRIVPFLHEIDGSTPKVENPVVVCGSIGIHVLAQKNNWATGLYFSDDLNCVEYKKHLGDLFLNSDAEFCMVSEVAKHFDKFQDDEEIFIRPSRDSKEFSGLTITKNKYESWLQNMRDIGYLRKNDFEVMLLKPKALGREWRCILIDKKVIEISQYRTQYAKKKEWVDITTHLDIVEIAEQAANKFYPVAVAVIDIAETNDGLKVIEYNTFNSAGLYACNVENIILSVNKYIEEK